VDRSIAAYVFDLYGTLLDFSSLRTRFVGLVADPDAFVATWREKQLQYALMSSAMQRYVDFDTLTAAAFSYAAERYGLDSGDAARDAAREAWAGLPAFPDVHDALAALRARGAKTAVLSNGTVASIERGVRAAGIAGAFDTLLSVEAVRVYKPDPRVYALATEHFDVPAERIAFVSSNGWDAMGGAEFGFTTIWCNRAGLPLERIGVAPHRTVRSLGELLDA
jgi:2-haloacid dehalogenase